MGPIWGRWGHFPTPAPYGRPLRSVRSGPQYPFDKKLAAKLLDEGDRRAGLLAEGNTPWTQAKGLVVRGFRSTIDDSVQPYGLEIPEKLELNHFE